MFGGGNVEEKEKIEMGMVYMVEQREIYVEERNKWLKSAEIDCHRGYEEQDGCFEQSKPQLLVPKSSESLRQNINFFGYQRSSIFHYQSR